MNLKRRDFTLRARVCWHIGGLYISCKVWLIVECKVEQKYWQIQFVLDVSAEMDGLGQYVHSGTTLVTQYDTTALMVLLVCLRRLATSVIVLLVESASSVREASI